MPGSGWHQTVQFWFGCLDQKPVLCVGPEPQSRQFAGLLTPTLSSGRRGRRKGPNCHPYVVVCCSRTPILPGSGRPTGRLPRGLCRYSAGYSRAHNYAFFHSNNEPNNAANNVRNNDWNDFANSLRYGDGSRLRSRSRFSAGFGCRHTCRRSSLHSERYLGRYLLTNDERCNGGLSLRLRLRPRERRRLRLRHRHLCQSVSIRGSLQQFASSA